jgi:hypothetical protein
MNWEFGILWVSCAFVVFLVLEESMRQCAVAFGNKMIFGKP